MLDSLDAGAVRRWCAIALAALRRHQREIDELNVYPIPDADTGTNLVATMEAAQRALLAEPDLADVDEVLYRMARGAVLGARGNSGVILAQIMRGIATTVGSGGDENNENNRPKEDKVRGRVLARALRTAADSAYTAVVAPVEGTVLTVARRAGQAAADCDSDDLAVVVTAASAAADDALAQTPWQLPTLAGAGVVDAGGRGLCVLLHALVEVVTGSVVDLGLGEVPAGEAGKPGEQLGMARRQFGAVPRESGLAGRESGSAEFDYEVQYLLDAPDPAVTRLRAELDGIGDSVVIVGTGDGSWNVHVHTNEVGWAIEAGVEAGRPYRIRVTRFADVDTPAPRTVVVFADDSGLVGFWERAGAVTSLDGVTGQVISLGAPPGWPAEWPQVEDLRVIPLRSPVQALAALAVHDPTRPFDDDVIAMAEASGACRYAEVTMATRAALTVAGPCREGDIVVLVDGEVNLVAQDLTDACVTVLDRLLAAGGELVTLLLGADAPPDLRPVLETHLQRQWPFAEFRAYEGGQAKPLLVGVE